jgi:omega-6 fatty acid desaturase (delta-12 desaturase)
MLTVREYNERTAFQKLVYRVYRHPLVLFGIAPLFYFGVYQRLMLEPPSWKKERWSVFWTNIVIVLGIAAMWWFVGLTGLLLVHLPISLVASSAGVWLFYVQHQFAPSYWQRNEEWDYFDAGIEGSSYYQLPKVLQWFTANIGLHHIHHVDSRIPNYRLQQCYDENPQFQRIHHLTLWQSLSCASLKLWDEDKGEMVAGFPQDEPSKVDSEQPCASGASAES